MGNQDVKPITLEDIECAKTALEANAVPGPYVLYGDPDIIAALGLTRDDFDGHGLYRPDRVTRYYVPEFAGRVPFITTAIRRMKRRVRALFA